MLPIVTLSNENAGGDGSTIACTLAALEDWTAVFWQTVSRFRPWARRAAR